MNAVNGGGADAAMPALGQWPPRTRWPDAVHRGIAALKGVLQGQKPALLALSLIHI